MTAQTDFRRRSVLEAATAEFGDRGLHAASTREIALRAGISEAYLFRLFPTKRRLFLDALEHGSAEALGMLARAEGGSDGPLAALSAAWVRICRDGEHRLVALQCFAAGTFDPELMDAAREHMRRLEALLRERSGASEPEVRDVIAQGLLAALRASCASGDAGRAEGGGHPPS